MGPIRPMGQIGPIGLRVPFGSAEEMTSMVKRFIIRFLFVYPVLGLIWGGIIGIISAPEGYAPSFSFDLGATFGCFTGTVFGLLTAWFTCPYPIKQVFMYPFLMTGVFSFLAALFGGEGAATYAWLLGMLGYIAGLSILAARGTKKWCSRIGFPVPPSPPLD